MRARYKQRLTRDDLGSRVTIRRWIEDEERGVRPSDVVGRLTAWTEDDELIVTRRDGTTVAVYEGDILTSRTIPEHPSLPPEPGGPPT